MEVLCVLAEHAGQVVSRSAIIDAVWGVAFGGDESLTRAISLLRKAMPTSQGRDIIQTISKRGYSLKAEPIWGSLANPVLEPAAVDIKPYGLPLRSWLVLATSILILGLLVVGALSLIQPQKPQSQITGIVVLVKPVAAPSPDEGELLADDLTASLARFDQIKVRRFEPGRVVDTDTAYVYVVSGSLTKSPSSRRFTVQLEDYQTGNRLWSGGETYSGPADKAVSALSAELEPAVLQAAKSEVQKKPATALSAWELILLGTWVPGADREWQGPPTADSYWVWERAIEKDPNFALAHASLAQVMANFALFDPPSDTPAHAARAMKSADRALLLAPYDAGVLFQNALYYRYAGKRAEAISTLRRVIDLEPDNIMARIELDYVTGQCAADSAGAIARLEALDAALPPSSASHWVILSHMADMSLARGDYQAARNYAARSRLIVRQIWSSITLAAADAELGNTAEAAKIATEHRGQWPAFDYARFADGSLSRWCLGGDTTYARQAFLKLGGVVASKQPG